MALNMEKKDICVEKLGKARPDGWVPSPRTTNEHVDYVVFPGN